MIVAPVSRQLAVSGVARSVAFYRDTLGFEDRSARGDRDAGTTADMVRGPARLELRAHDGASGPAERRILFFQVDDVDAMHAALAAAGAGPTAPEDVNWIKMRMFEVRDPDGHALWFGR